MEPWRWHLQTCKHLVTVMAGDTPELARRWRRLREVSGTGSLIARRQEPVAEEVREVTTHKSRLCHRHSAAVGALLAAQRGLGAAVQKHSCTQLYTTAAAEPRGERQTGPR